MTNLADIDLNLLVALEALLSEANVTRAAAVVGVTQPTMSRSLGRLRRQLGDQLLVLSGRGMVRTERGDRVHETLRHSLAALRRLLAAEQEFVPASSKKCFELAAPDILGIWLLPTLMHRLRTLAPGAALSVRRYDVRDVPGQLESGAVDIAVGTGLGSTEGLMRSVLREEHWVSLVRHGHPRVDDRLDLDTFIGSPHALAGPGGSGPGSVDAALEALGVRRRVVLRSSHFVTIATVAAETDLIATFPRVAGLCLAQQLGLRAFVPPIALKPLELAALWHRRFDAEPAHRWFRRELLSCARGLLRPPRVAVPGSAIPLPARRTMKSAGLR